MKYIKLKLSDQTYNSLNKKFKNDEKLMSNFAAKILNDELSKIFLDESKSNSDLNTKDLENYLKSGKTGSRSYGTKGQGW